MQIDRIQYEETFPTAIQYKNIRLMASATLNIHDDVAECYQRLKDNVRQGFKALGIMECQHIDGFHMETTKLSQPVPSIDRKKQTLIEIINDSATLEELIAIKDEVGKYGLVDMYADKLEALKNKKA